MPNIPSIYNNLSQFNQPKQQQQGSGFQDVSQSVQANKQAAQNEGNQLATNLNQQSNQASGQVNAQGQQAQNNVQGVESGLYNNYNNISGQLTNDNAAGIDANAYKQATSGQAQQVDTTGLQNTSAGIGNVQQNAQNVNKSDESRAGLIAKAVNAPIATQGLNPTQQNLDSILVGRNYNVQGLQNQQQKQATDLNNQYNQYMTTVNKGNAGNQNLASSMGQKLQTQTQNEIGDVSNAAQQQAQALNSQAGNEANYVSSGQFSKDYTALNNPGPNQEALLSQAVHSPDPNNPNQLAYQHASGQMLGWSMANPTADPNSNPFISQMQTAKQALLGQSGPNTIQAGPAVTSPYYDQIMSSLKSSGFDPNSTNVGNLTADQVLGDLTSGLNATKQVTSAQALNDQQKANLGALYNLTGQTNGLDLTQSQVTDPYSLNSFNLNNLTTAAANSTAGSIPGQALASTSNPNKSNVLKDIIMPVPSAISQGGKWVGNQVGGSGGQIIDTVANAFNPSNYWNKGGLVPGNAPVKGDHQLNDIIHALLSPGEVVVPRSVVSKGKKDIGNFIDKVLKDVSKS